MSHTFEPDGWDVRLRVGLLVPDGDVGPESEWSAITPAGTAVHSSRFHFPVQAVTNPGDTISMGSVEYVAADGPLDTAIGLYNPAWIDVFALAFTSTSYVGDDSELVNRLSDKARRPSPLPVRRSGRHRPGIDRRQRVPGRRGGACRRVGHRRPNHHCKHRAPLADAESQAVRRVE